MAHQQTWHLPARVDRVVDGDTVDFSADLGFRISYTFRCRLYGIDAAETRGSDRPEGLRSTGTLIDLIEDYRIDEYFEGGGEKPWVKIESHKNKSDKYGRWIIRIIGRRARGGTGGWEDVDLNREMVRLGAADPSDVGKEKSPYWDTFHERQRLESER